MAYVPVMKGACGERIYESIDKRLNKYYSAYEREENQNKDESIHSLLADHHYMLLSGFR